MSQPIQADSHQNIKATIRTRKVSQRLDIKWIIEDYVQWVDTIPKNGKVLSHPIKLVEKSSDTAHEIKLRFYPKGYTMADSEGYISVFISYQGPKKVLECEYEINIQKTNGELFPVLGKRNRHLDFIGDGQHKILQVSKLVNEKDQFLQNGALVFAGYVQLDAFENEYSEYSNESKTLLKENLETKAPQMALLGKYFKDTNNENEYEGDFSDFKIICGDRKEKRSFDVHRVIIAAGSPVFRAMLTNDCKERDDMSVVVSDISPGTMEKLLCFLYTGMIDAENVDTDLLSAANKYDIEKLKATCELHLIDGLEEPTAIHFGVISEMYGSELFKNEVSKFIGQHWMQIKQNEDHLNIVKNYPDLMLRIMRYCN